MQNCETSTLTVPIHQLVAPGVKSCGYPQIPPKLANQRFCPVTSVVLGERGGGKKKRIFEESEFCQQSVKKMYFPCPKGNNSLLLYLEGFSHQQCWCCCCLWNTLENQPFAVAVLPFTLYNRYFWKSTPGHHFAVSLFLPSSSLLQEPQISCFIFQVEWFVQQRCCFSPR